MTARDPQTTDPRDDERQRRQKQRNRAAFLILVGFVVLTYLITIVKIKISGKL